MMVKSTVTVFVCFRLGFDVEARLRRRIGNGGDLGMMIEMVLHLVDLEMVPILDLGGNCEDQSAVTAVVLPAAMHTNLKRLANLRQCTVNSLVNSAIWAYTGGNSEKK
jgi:hypothetical protein